MDGVVLATQTSTLDTFLFDWDTVGNFIKQNIRFFAFFGKEMEKVGEIFWRIKITAKHREIKFGIIPAFNRTLRQRWAIAMGGIVVLLPHIPGQCRLGIDKFQMSAEKPTTIEETFRENEIEIGIRIRGVFRFESVTTS